MHLRNDTIDIMINDEADEVIEELLNPILIEIKIILKN